MNWLNGQERTAWLHDALDKYVANPLNYYLGPTGIPERLQGAGNALMFTDAADMAEATQASANLWNDPSFDTAVDYATAGAALALPFASKRLIDGVWDAAGELAEHYDPTTLNALRVWHGSPHDFDKFSLDHIGTGEGAQAYGHGLYFAEEADVARGYEQALQNFDTGPLDEIGIPPSEWNAARAVGQTRLIGARVTGKSSGTSTRLCLATRGCSTLR